VWVGLIAVSVGILTVMVGVGVIVDVANGVLVCVGVGGCGVALGWINRTCGLGEREQAASSNTFKRTKLNLSKCLFISTSKI
jgi:hypothetical protein